MMCAISEDEVELNNTLLKDACDTHERSLATKEKKLLETKRQIEETENRLKCMYGRMVDLFEKEFDSPDS